MANSVLITSATSIPTWSTVASGTATTYTLDGSNGISAPMMVNRGGKISLEGKDADININGVSLKDTLQGIQERLGLLEINKELEEEYEQLLELGKQYRELESKLLEQKRVFDILKNKNIK